MAKNLRKKSDLWSKKILEGNNSFKVKTMVFDRKILDIIKINNNLNH